MIFSAIALSFISTNSLARDFVYHGSDPGNDPEINFVLTIDDDSDIAEYENIDISLNPPIDNDRYTVYVTNGQNLKVSGNTTITLEANKYVDIQDNGTNALHATGAGTTIDLNGNVHITTVHNVENTGGSDPAKTIGANAVYAKDGANINIGDLGTKTLIWAIGEKPDAISAKSGGSVNFKSTHIQLIGSIDTMDDYVGTKGSKVNLSISDNGYYWFGDDNTMLNVSVSIPEEYALRLGLDKTSFSGVTELNELLENPDVVALIERLRRIDLGDNPQVKDEFNLTVSNGAQWTYFGSTKGEEQDGFKVASIQKRVSSIELMDGGIINLFDQDIQQTWKQIGLTDLWKDVADLDHDYVRIGDLKGNGGIFRLDLNSDSDNQKNSDMVFIESSSTGGTHFIEPYRPQDLASVSDTNRLTFALVAANKDGSDSVRFADKQNIYGESLFDYELGISSEAITEENIQDFKKLVNDNYQIENFDINDYLNGTHWYINRLLVKESAASIGMRSAGYASYDLAVSMDRRDRRLHNTVFQDGQKDGLWARIQYGENGAEHLYDADLTTVYVGYEKAISADNRLGFSFGYTDGSTDFNDVKGNGDLKRYEASIYDTLTFGSHYLDFVSRFGQVENDFDVTNQTGKLSTSGSFDQKYAALSVEYGFNYKDEHNVFIEPQLQLQAAYLDSYSYHTERNMKVKADSDISLIGRAGIRAGKTFEASNYAGELYARADVLHQFTDGQDADFSDLSNKIGVTWGDKDTWATFGIGSYFNWNDKMSFQVDIERTAGGETIDTWLISGRANYLF